MDRDGIHLWWKFASLPKWLFPQFTHCTWPSEQQLLRCAQLPSNIGSGSKDWQHNSAAKTKPCWNQPGYSPLMPCAHPGQLEIHKCRRFCDALIRWPLSTPEAYCTHQQAQIRMCNHSHSHQQNRACCCSSTSIVASTMSRISSNESCDWGKKNFLTHLNLHKADSALSLKITLAEPKAMSAAKVKRT